VPMPRVHLSDEEDLARSGKVGDSREVRGEIGEEDSTGPGRCEKTATNFDPRGGERRNSSAQDERRCGMGRKNTSEERVGKKGYDGDSGARWTATLSIFLRKHVRLSARMLTASKRPRTERPTRVAHYEVFSRK